MSQYSYRGEVTVGIDKIRATIIFPVHGNERQDRDVTLYFSKDELRELRDAIDAALLRDANDAYERETGFRKPKAK